MTDSVYEAQLRRQLYEARQEVISLRADRARLEGEVGPLRQQLADALDRATLAERQAAAKLPLICSDERHQAKVQALEAKLAAVQQDAEGSRWDVPLPPGNIAPASPEAAREIGRIYDAIRSGSGVFEGDSQSGVRP